MREEILEDDGTASKFLMTKVITLAFSIEAISLAEAIECVGVMRQEEIWLENVIKTNSNAGRNQSQG